MSTEYNTNTLPLHEKLREHRLQDALNLCRKKIEETSFYGLLAEVDQLQRDYEALLAQVRIDGIGSIPDVKEQHAALLRRAWQMSDAIVHAVTFMTGTEYPHKVWSRLHAVSDAEHETYEPFVPGTNGRPATLTQLLEEPACSYIQIFDTIWTTRQWTADDSRTALDYVCDESHPRLVRLTLIKAVIVALLTAFDEVKYNFLIELLLMRRIDQSAPAMTGLTLALLRYAPRLDVYPHLVERLRDIFECDDDLRRLAFANIKSFCGVARSRTLSHRLEEEIPAQIRQIFEQAKAQGFESLTPDVLEKMVEENFNTSDFRGRFLNTFQEYRNLHDIGIDVNIRGFMYLIRDCDFFREAANWCCPFDRENSVLHSVGLESRFFVMMTHGYSSHTDRYAMLLCLKDQLPQVKVVRKDVDTDEEELIPDDEVSEFIDMVNAQIESIEADPARNELFEMPDEEMLEITTPHMIDFGRMYAYFHCLPEESNPFANPDLTHIPIVPYIVTSEADRHHFADYLIKINEPAYALEMLNDIPRSYDVCLTLAGCYVRLGQDEEATACFREAVRYDSTNKFIKTILVGRYIQSGEIALARELLDDLLAESPDNIILLKQRARVALLLGDHEEAYQLYTKIDYLDSENPTGLRCLAWTCLLLGRIDRAEEILNRLISGPNPIAADYLRSGHCSLLRGDWPSAVVYYQEAVHSTGKSEAQLDLFEAEDLSLLADHGIDHDTILLLLDLINQ